MRTGKQISIYLSAERLKKLRSVASSDQEAIRLLIDSIQEQKSPNSNGKRKTRLTMASEMKGAN